MFGKFYNIVVTRNDFPAPYTRVPAKLYMTTSYAGRRSMNVPLLGHAQTTLVYSAPAGTDCRVGDVISLCDTPYAPLLGEPIGKLVDVCPHAFSVQAAVQRTPWLNLRWFRAATMAESVATDGTLNVNDVVYVNAGSLLGYFEPMSNRDLIWEFGRVDIRAARLFSMSPIDQNAAVQDIDGRVWMAKTASQRWPIIDDFVTVVTLEVVPPSGIVK